MSMTILRRQKKSMDLEFLSLKNDQILSFSSPELPILDASHVSVTAHAIIGYTSIRVDFLVML